MCTGGGVEGKLGRYETNYLTFGGYETNYDICGGGGGTKQKMSGILCL